MIAFASKFPFPQEITYEVDCDSDPFVPDGSSVESHTRQGRFRWNSKLVELFLVRGQRVLSGSIGNAEELYAALQSEISLKRLYNANLMHFLLNQQNLIPRTWKVNSKANKVNYIIFWGTVYVDSKLRKNYVFCMYWSKKDRSWMEERRYINNGWCPYACNSPAAVISA